jgi:aminomethyltransferase
MSREVHNGPTDETQARGTPYSGDPEGGAGTHEVPLDKLPLDSWPRARGGRVVPVAGDEMAGGY